MSRLHWQTCSLVLLATACQAESIVEVGIVHFHGESEDVIESPGTAGADEPFLVTVNTYGNGCHSAESMSIDGDERILELTPYDREDVSHPCPAVLLRIAHTAEVMFAEPGMKTLRVRGRRVDPQDDVLIELETQIVVE